MKQILYALLVLIAIPSIGLGVFLGINHSYIVPDAMFGLLRDLSIGSLVVGLLLIAFIKIGGALAQNSQALLSLIFTPLLYLTLTSTAFLMIAHAIILMSSIYYAETVWAHRLHVFVIGAIGLGAFIGVITMIGGLFSIVENRRIKTSIMGYAITKEDAPRLWTYVNIIADSLGALRPDNIVIGVGTDFFVTESDVRCFSGDLKGRTLCCSASLCQILSKKELASIIGHELGHFKGKDTKYSQKFAPIYRGTVSTIVNLDQVKTSDWGKVSLIPAMLVLDYFLDSFTIAEKRISRYRELLADQAGASVESPKVFAAALVKICAYSRIWDGLPNHIAKTLNEGKYYPNACKFFADVCANNSNKDMLNGMDAVCLPHPTDSHPPLSERLNALNVSMSDIEVDSLNSTPEDVAIELINNHEGLEQKLSYNFQMILADRMGIRLDQSDESSQESA